MKVTGNEIKIDVYIEIIDATDKLKAQIRKGIMQWEGTYKYVCGHKAKLKMEIHEKNDTWSQSQKSISIYCMKEEDCLKEEDDDETKNDFNNRSHACNNPEHSEKFPWRYDYGDIYLFPISIAPETEGWWIFKHDKMVKEDKENDDKKDSKENNDKKKEHVVNVVRKLTDKEYKNIVTHEFGHVLGLPDMAAEAESSNNLAFHQILLKKDIMATAHYSDDVYISSLDIQMIVSAAHYRMQQLVIDYDNMGTVNSLRYRCETEDKTD